MWKILKSEFIYNWYFHTTLILLILGYSLLSNYNVQILAGPEFDIDYWGGIYSIVIYAFLFLTWGNRIREKRILQHLLLPVTITQNAYARFLIVALPFLFINIYLIFVQLVIANNWYAETNSLIGQLGVVLIFFASFIRGRDDWYSNWNLGKRFQKTFVTLFIVQIIVVFIFLGMPEFKKTLVNTFGNSALNYSTIIFPITGFTVLVLTIYSYRNRRVFLS